MREAAGRRCRRRLASIWPVVVAAAGPASAVSVGSDVEARRLDASTAPFLQFSNGENVTVQCADFLGRIDRDETFSASCLPKEFQSYSFLAGKGYDEEPFIYNSWIFAEGCGLQYMTYRYDNFRARRDIVHEAVEAVILNWFVYITGVLLATVVMNIFFIAPRGRRCCGLFEAHPDPDDPHPRFTYKTCLAPFYILMFIWSVMILVACTLQFFSEQVRFRNGIHDITRDARVWQYNETGNLTQWYIVPSPDHTCRQSMFLNWPCDRNLLEVLVLAMFSFLDLIALAIVLCTTGMSIALSCIRVFCCCIWWRSACNHALCVCSSNFSSSFCLSWCFCGPIAFLFFVVFTTVVVGGYFFIALLTCLLVLFVFLFVIAAIILALEFLTRKAIELISCGKCQILDVPLSRYAQALFPLPHHALQPPRPKPTGPPVKPDDEDEHINKEDEEANHRPEQASQAGWEEEIMGVPYHFLSFAFPILMFIAAAPLVVLIGVAVICFPWADRLAHIVSWANNDMDWYVERMDSVSDVWTWYWQIFVCLLGGVSDAFRDMFNDLWGIFRFDDKSTWSRMMESFEVGIQFWNVFNLNNVKDFVSAVLVSRFWLSFLFACCRITALINYSTEADIWEKRGEYPPEARPLSRGGQQDSTRSVRDTMYNQGQAGSTTSSPGASPSFWQGMHAPSWASASEWVHNHGWQGTRGAGSPAPDAGAITQSPPLLAVPNSTEPPIGTFY